MASHDHFAPLLAAADLRRAAGAILARLGSVSGEPIRLCGDFKLAALAESLADPAATGETTVAAVIALLARCEAAIEAGTRVKTEWMPKACVGDDVVEWEAWTRPEVAPEAARLEPLARDLRSFLEAHERLRGLLDAEATLAAMRRDRAR